LGCKAVLSRVIDNLDKEQEKGIGFCMVGGEVAVRLLGNIQRSSQLLEAGFSVISMQ
jgi:hypothetical protein